MVQLDTEMQLQYVVVLVVTLALTRSVGRKSEPNVQNWITYYINTEAKESFCSIFPTLLVTYSESGII